MPSKRQRSKINRARKMKQKRSIRFIGLLMRTRSVRTNYLESDDLHAVYSELRWERCTDGMPGYVQKRKFKLPREEDECILCCQKFDESRKPADTLPCPCPPTTCRKCFMKWIIRDEFLSRVEGTMATYIAPCPTCKKSIGAIVSKERLH